MKKKAPDNQQLLPLPKDVLESPALRRRRNLILPRYLREEAEKPQCQVTEQHEGYKTIVKWADLETQGGLRKKETELDALFLTEVFGQALGFKTPTRDPEDYNLELQLSVPGGGTADGALGCFSTGTKRCPKAIIELKGAATDLDKDKFNGRTPVQQCWDYLNALPDCPWGILSNFSTIRLYHRDKTPIAFEHFTLQELRNIRRFREFWCLLKKDQFLPVALYKTPPIQELLKRTSELQREVGDQLYDDYSGNRQAMVYHLHREKGHDLDWAIRVAQKILDRIIFTAFCEDRGLLPNKIIEKTYKNLPPFTKVTNPRWRNFLDLFRAIDEGHENLKIDEGYDGGLFRHDPDVDDLQLSDEWTKFFQDISTYDFRDEINVDVLGHLFEKSITELERLRVSGLFEAPKKGEEKPGKMPKSPKRKKLGIFYTPIEFTSFIVHQTVEKVIEQRFSEIARRHGVDPNNPEAEAPSPEPVKYWNECLEALREIRVCDPACGSGAFLIQAYDVLEEHYTTVIDNLLSLKAPEAEKLAEGIPDMILAENLFGVDLSPEAVEITQLALWIRSARRGRTLADLSGNIVCGNSLVTDPAVDQRAMNWKEVFPNIFKREESGFDCVIGNPPWERLKLQEREFFAFSAPDIAEAVIAAERRKLISQLERKKPEHYARYVEAKETADAVLEHVRRSGEFPLTAKGDINTYMLFAELARKIVSPHGRVGILVPSGIATDKTTKDFFAELVNNEALIRLYDFENKEAFFPDVHRSFKFCTLVFGGRAIRTKSADFVFFARTMDDVADKKRHIPLSAKDFALLNPNTRTCPIFRSRRDAELTKAIYKRVSILVDRSRDEGGNPWGIRFLRMFDQTNDAELFKTGEELEAQGFKLRGNCWTKRKERHLPLYEAKMVQAYDHRAASVVIEPENWMRQGQTDETSLVSHQNPEFVVHPRWWVDEAEASEAIGGDVRPGYLCYKDVTSPTNERTMIAAFIPFVGVVNSAPLVLTGSNIPCRLSCCLLANLNSLVLDYVARQKVGNIHLNFFIVNQLPVLPPETYSEECRWRRSYSLERWVSDRVLKLTCTANDMLPLAEACGFKPQVHKWKANERARLMAELDAAYFILYGVPRSDVEYVLSTFTGIRQQEGPHMGRFRTADLILDAYDTLSGR